MSGDKFHDTMMMLQIWGFQKASRPDASSECGSPQPSDLCVPAHLLAHFSLMF